MILHWFFFFLVKYKCAFGGPFPKVSFQDLKQYKKSDVAVQMQGMQKCQSLTASDWGTQSGLRDVVACCRASAFQGEEVRDQLKY